MQKLYILTKGLKCAKSVLCKLLVLLSASSQNSCSLLKVNSGTWNIIHFKQKEKHCCVNCVNQIASQHINCCLFELQIEITHHTLFEDTECLFTLF